VRGASRKDKTRLRTHLTQKRACHLLMPRRINFDHSLWEDLGTVGTAALVRLAQGLCIPPSLQCKRGCRLLALVSGRMLTATTSAVLNVFTTRFPDSARSSTTSRSILSPRIVVYYPAT
jgi:hypothetical protein